APWCRPRRTPCSPPLEKGNALNRRRFNFFYTLPWQGGRPSSCPLYRTSNGGVERGGSYPVNPVDVPRGFCVECRFGRIHLLPRKRVSSHQMRKPPILPVPCGNRCD